MRYENYKDTIKNGREVREFNVSNNNQTGLFDCFRGTRLTKQNRKPGNIPLLTAGNGIGEGVAEFIDENKLMKKYKEDITIDMFGGVFYHDYEHYGDDNIHFLVNNDISSLSKLFITVLIRKKLSGIYSYGYQFRMKNLDDLKLFLPIQLSVDNTPVIDPEHKYHPEGYIPDWKYMQDYIKELEQKYISELEQHNVKELEQYLIATGLNDYELTDEDKEVLDPGNKPFKEFIVEDIIKVEQTKSVISKSNLVDGDIPYVTRTISNNGYMSKCGNEDKINKGNCITIGAETGVAFYQPNDFVAGNKVYRLSVNDLGEKHYLFMASALNKLTKDYSYSNARIPEKIKKEHIFLPIQISIDNSPVIDPTHKYHPEGYIPDWDYMEKYINAIEKLVIKDVIKYKDEMIGKMKEITSRS